MILKARINMHSRIFEVDYKQTKGLFKKACGPVAKLSAPRYSHVQNLDIAQTQ